MEIKQKTTNFFMNPYLQMPSGRHEHERVVIATNQRRPLHRAAHAFHFAGILASAAHRWNASIEHVCGIPTAKPAVTRKLFWVGDLDRHRQDNKDAVRKLFPFPFPAPVDALCRLDEAIHQAQMPVTAARAPILLQLKQLELRGSGPSKRRR